jgi:hypothetical protein
VLLAPPVTLCDTQAILEEDALRFDAFLKENDERVQAAIKHADVQAKAKQDKVCACVRLRLSRRLHGCGGSDASRWTSLRGGRA